MSHLQYSPPTRDILSKIYTASSAVRGADAKDVRCPYCGRLLLRKYPDVQGHIDGKCDKCGKTMVIDLVSWRRAAVKT